MEICAPWGPGARITENPRDRCNCVLDETNGTPMCLFLLLSVDFIYPIEDCRTSARLCKQKDGRGHSTKM